MEVKVGLNYFCKR